MRSTIMRERREGDQHRWTGRGGVVSSWWSWCSLVTWLLASHQTLGLTLIATMDNPHIQNLPPHLMCEKMLFSREELQFGNHTLHCTLTGWATWKQTNTFPFNMNTHTHTHRVINDSARLYLLVVWGVHEVVTEVLKVELQLYVGHRVALSYELVKVLVLPPPPPPSILSL